MGILRSLYQTFVTLEIALQASIATVGETVRDVLKDLYAPHGVKGFTVRQRQTDAIASWKTQGMLVEARGSKSCRGNSVNRSRGESKEPLGTPHYQLHEIHYICRLGDSRKYPYLYHGLLLGFLKGRGGSLNWNSEGMRGYLQLEI